MCEAVCECVDSQDGVSMEEREDGVHRGGPGPVVRVVLHCVTQRCLWREDTHTYYKTLDTLLQSWIKFA